MYILELFVRRYALQTTCKRMIGVLSEFVTIDIDLAIPHFKYEESHRVYIF